MSGWWLLAPVVLVVGIGLVAVTVRRLQREAAGVRSAAVELADLRAEGEALADEADALAEHLTRTRSTAGSPLGGGTGDR
jgi:cell division protein FtsB